MKHIDFSFYLVVFSAVAMMIGICIPNIKINEDSTLYLIWRIIVKIVKILLWCVVIVWMLIASIFVADAFNKLTKKLFD